MFIHNSILVNVNTSKVTTFLASRGIKREDNDRGLDYNKWLGKIIEENKITSEVINEFLFQQLMYGNRRLIRYYGIKNSRKIKYSSDWTTLLKNFNCESMMFNKILETNFDNEERCKIAAIKSIHNGEQALKRVEVLFVYKVKMRVESNNGITHSYSYIPVTFDFETRTMTMKVWNREGAYEDNGPTFQLNKIYYILISQLNFETKSLEENPQKVLYRMSKSLFEEFFNSLPNIKDLENKKDSLDDVVSELLKDIALKNNVIKDSKISMNSEVIDVKEELYKLLQQVALYDYLKDNDIEKLLLNTDKVIARIKFSDRDNLSASLTGEKGVRCIFDTKTFQCIRNSLEQVEYIDCITITFNMNGSKMTVKYDASNNEFLNVHILYSKYYSIEDYNIIWELYKKYETGDDTEISFVREKYNISAM